MESSLKKDNSSRQAGGVPRLAMINDIAGFGRCSTTVALPVISVMKVQVCPVPASILSNHLGFSTCYFDDYTSHMREYLHAWEQLSLTFDGLYCGFLGSVEQFTIVHEFLDSPMLQGRPLFLLDPVLGDHGRTYSSITAAHCAKMKKLAERADILTPNITEACLLTDTPYRKGSWEESSLYDICCRLAGDRKDRRIVITGLEEQNHILNYIWENNQSSICYTQITGASRPGTGDLFASILAADALNGVPFAHSVRKAADFVALCIRVSEEAGTPTQEGVLFEKCLNKLCD